MKSKGVLLFKALVISTVVLAGCSSAVKERKEQRDKLAQTSKFYCEFINGEVYQDIDVALNLEMAKRCDADKPYTVTPYKTASENNGVIYCCTMKASALREARAEAKAEEHEEKAAAPAAAPVVAPKVVPNAETKVEKAKPAKSEPKVEKADGDVPDVLKEAMKEQPKDAKK